MKKIIYISFVFFILISNNSCKKTKLNNDLSYLVGTWQWVNGYDDNGTTNYYLKFNKKGKYDLCSGSKKIEYGRLNYDNNYIKFTSDNLFKSNLFLNNRSIKSHINDTIIITKLGFTDQPYSVFVKK